MPGVVSQACTQEQCESSAHRRWCAVLREEPKLHRKQWEFTYILQALREAGMLRPGTRGLGFGVGKEALLAGIAAHGCELVATDLSPDSAGAKVWVGSGQNSEGGLAGLNDRGICSPEDFARRVTYRDVDMTSIPADLANGSFDFCWSSCAYEHLGSIEAGLKFVEDSMRCLRPGGVAVHTTELNVHSNDATWESGLVVIFRRRDFEALAARLTAGGHTVAPLNFALGTQPADLYVDVPPFANIPHLKLALGQHVSTSFGMIVRRGDR